MRAQVQRVLSALVRVDSEIVGQIGSGLLAYVASHAADAVGDIDYIADKIANLRIFPDDEGKMNRSVLDVGGGVLVISAFSLYADARKGRRPSFIDSAPPEVAAPQIERLCEKLRGLGVPVETGRFRAYMQVESVNDGPICVPLDSTRLF